MGRRKKEARLKEQTRLAVLQATKEQRVSDIRTAHLLERQDKQMKIQRRDAKQQGSSTKHLDPRRLGIPSLRSLPRHLRGVVRDFHRHPYLVRRKLKSSDEPRNGDSDQTDTEVDTTFETDDSDANGLPDDQLAEITILPPIRYTMRQHAPSPSRADSWTKIQAAILRDRAEDPTNWLQSAPVAQLFNELADLNTRQPTEDPNAAQQDLELFRRSWCRLASVLNARAFNEGQHQYTFMIVPGHVLYPYADDTLRPGNIFPSSTASASNSRPLQPPQNGSVGSGFAIDPRLLGPNAQVTARPSSYGMPSTLSSAQAEQRGSGQISGGPQVQNAPSSSSGGDKAAATGGGGGNAGSQHSGKASRPSLLVTLPLKRGFWNGEDDSVADESGPPPKKSMLQATTTVDEDTYDGSEAPVTPQQSALDDFVSTLSAVDAKLWQLKATTGRPQWKTVTTKVNDELAAGETPMTEEDVRKRWMELQTMQYNDFASTLSAVDAKLWQLRTGTTRSNWKTILNRVNETLPAGRTKLTEEDVKKRWLELQTMGEAHGIGKVKISSTSWKPAKEPTKEPARKPAKEPTKEPAEKAVGSGAHRHQPRYHASLRALWTDIQFEVCRLYEEQRLGFAQIQQRLNSDMPIEEHRSEEFYRHEFYAATNIREKWSTADCFAVLEHLELQATEARSRIYDERQRQGQSPPPSEEFDSPDYEDLPEVVLRDIARTRGIGVVRRGRTEECYRDVLLSLMENDASRGRPPLRPRALDIYSDPPPSHDIGELQKLARRNRDMIIGLRGDNDQNVFDASWWRNPERRKGELKPVFYSRFVRQCASSLPKASDGTHGLVPNVLVQQRMLWYLDAREGIDPPAVVPYGNTRFHGMFGPELEKEARKMGAPLDIIRAQTADFADEDSEAEAEADADADVASSNRIETMRQWLILHGGSMASLSEQELHSILEAMGPELGQELARIRGVPVSSISNTTLDQAVRSHTGRLVGTREAYEHLERHTQRAFAPGEASTRGYLCGIDALLQALHDTRRFHNRRWSPRITVDEVMRLRFSNWDPTRELDETVHGELTPEFRDFLENHIVQNVGLPLGSPEFEEEMRQYATLNMSDVNQLYLTLRFLEVYGFIESNHSLMIVTQGRQRLNTQDPATVHVLGDLDDNTRIVALHHDNAHASDDADRLARQGVMLIGHWTPFVLYGHRLDMLDSWGLHRIGADQLPRAATIVPIRRHKAHLSTNERDRLVARTEHQRHRLAKKKCFACQESNHDCDIAGTPASKVVGNKCGRCTELGIECEFDELIRTIERIAVRDLTADDIRAWDNPLSDDDWEKINQATENALPVAISKDGSSKFALHIHSMRVSSRRSPEDMMQLMARLPQMHNRVNNYTNSGQPTPEAQRPGGAGCPLQFYGIAYAGRALIPWPTRLSNNLADPYLRGLVRLLDSYLNPNNPVPTAILITTSGFAGGTVPITGYGNHSRGFFARLKEIDHHRGSSLAKNTDLMSVIQPHAHHGFPHSISAQAAALFTGPYHGKYMLRNGLADLIERFESIQHYASLPAQPPLVRGDAILTQRLDMHLLLLDNEAAWRSHWLDATTIPTDLDLMNRNLGRNDPW